MRHHVVAFAAAAVFGSGATSTSIAPELVGLVDTRIGTGGVGFAIGELNPGAQVPFGSLRLGPDTSLGLGFELLPFNHYGGYYDNDTHIRAFSHTHLVGAGVGDYGNIGVIASNKSITVEDAHTQAYRSRFSHDQETAQPGLYEASLLDSGVTARMTATGPFSGIHRYECSSGEFCNLIIDLCHSASENMTDACRFAGASLSQAQAPAGCAGMQVSGSVVNHGSLSGRTQFGEGVEIFFAMKVSPLTANSSVCTPAWGANVSVWHGELMDQVTLAAAPAFNTTSGSAGTWLRAPYPAVSGYEVRVGISFVSAVSAGNNALVEQAGIATFDQGVAAAQSEWEAMLSRVAVGPAAPALPVPEQEQTATKRQLNASALAQSSRTEPQNLFTQQHRDTVRAVYSANDANMPRQRDVGDWQAQQRRVFYSGMYRSLLAPSIFSEASGDYRSFAGDVRPWGASQPAGSRYRTDMSLWDIHRSQSAWLTLAAPSAARDVTNSLTRMEQDGGKLPRWPLANVYTGCMIGSHAVAVMADASLRGTGGVNTTAAYTAALRAVEQQANTSRYGTLGWVPSEESGRGASETMAFAFDDGVVSNWAVSAAVPGGAPGPAERASNWKNVLTTPADSTGPFPCPRDASGAFSCPDDLALPYPFETSYVEADAWQNRWFVPAQAEALVGAFPDNATFASQLELLMNQSLGWPLGGEKSWIPNAWYWAGNEPGLFAPWQFVFAGNDFAAKTQYWVRLMTQLAYGPDADGLPGNDDFGTMSAWQVLAMLGLYPVPGSNKLVLGSPAFQNASLGLPPAEAATALGFRDLEDACEADKRLCTSFSAGDLVPLLAVQWDSDVVTRPGFGVYASGATLNGSPLSRPIVAQQDLFKGAGARGLKALLDAGASVLVFRASSTAQPWSA